MRPALFRGLLPALLLALSTPAYAQHADASAPAATATEPNEAVSSVDLRRYSGKWYEIAHLPMFFQRKCVGDTTALYTPLADGTMAVRNRCRDEDGTFQQVDGEARQVGESTSKLEVRFAPGWLSWLPMVWGDYWVIALDEQYQWTMVGAPKADYLWILSRTPTMDDALREELLAKAQRMGYPVDKVELTPQPAAIAAEGKAEASRQD